MMTEFVSTPNPASERLTSFATTRSSPFRRLGIENRKMQPSTTITKCDTNAPTAITRASR